MQHIPTSILLSLPCKLPFLFWWLNRLFVLALTLGLSINATLFSFADFFLVVPFTFIIINLLLCLFFILLVVVFLILLVSPILLQVREKR